MATAGRYAAHDWVGYSSDESASGSCACAAAATSAFVRRVRLAGVPLVFFRVVSYARQPSWLRRRGTHARLSPARPCLHRDWSAKQSGGQVCIYSEVGKGTVVSPYLPRHLGGSERAEQPPELVDALRAQWGETVLVVDDEPTVRMLVTEVLQELGYIAIEAADGAAGLRVLQSDVRIDLVVTDVGLPGGMNGRQMADAARVTRPGLKVVFITGYAENAVVSQGHLEQGMACADQAICHGGLGQAYQKLDLGLIVLSRIVAEADQLRCLKNKFSRLVQSSVHRSLETLDIGS